MPKKPAKRRTESTARAGAKKPRPRKPRPKSSGEGSAQADRSVDSGDGEDPLDVRRLMEGNEGLEQMFAQALLSAQGGDLTDASAFADMLLDAICASPRDEVEGKSADEAFEGMTAPAKPKRSRRSKKDVEDEKPLRRPKQEGRSRPPRL